MVGLSLVELLTVYPERGILVQLLPSHDYATVDDQQHMSNLVPRVLRLFGQQVGTRRDSGVMEFLPQKSCGSG